MTRLDDAKPDFSAGESVPDVTTRGEPEADVVFSPLPAAAGVEKNYTRWQKSFLAYLYRERALTLYRCKKLKMVSRPGESEGGFRAKMAHALHQKRDAELAKLRSRYAPKLQKIEERVHKASVRVARESDQYSAQKTQMAISIGETLLGALFGRKLGSRTNVGRASRTARSATRASREREDVARAKKALKEVKRKLRRLEEELAAKTSALRADVDPAHFDLEEVPLRFRKSDTTLGRFALAWCTEEENA